MKAELRLAIKDAARDGMGGHCASVHHPDGRIEKRTEWQDGWNAYGLAYLQSIIKITKWVEDALTEEQQDMFAELIDESIVYLYVCDDDNGVDKLYLTVSCNDLFYWACADSEDIESKDIAEVHRAFKTNGWKGVDKWTCMRRNKKPQQPIINDWKKDGFWDAELEALNG